MKLAARRAIAAISANERGAAIIELALVAPFLAGLTIGIVDMSNAFSRKLALEQGAQRAIEKVSQTTELSTVQDTLKLEACVQIDGANADGTCKNTLVTANDVTVTWRRECTDASGTISQAPGSPYSSSADFDLDANDCPAATVKEANYIQVSIANTYTPMFPIHFASYNSTRGGYRLSATAGVRTK
jgi:Flp pilus assembly protein TadG